MALKPVSRQEYIVEFPDSRSVETNWPHDVAQNRTEKNLSTPVRKVATLAPDQVERLRHTIGVQVFVNQPVSIPRGENQSRRLVGADSIHNKLTVSVPTHGAD